MNLAVPHVESIRDRDFKGERADPPVTADRAAVVGGLGLVKSLPQLDHVGRLPAPGAAVVGLRGGAHPALALEHVPHLELADLAFAQDQVVIGRDRVARVVLEPAFSGLR